jgi:hypothetical protein
MRYRGPKATGTVADYYLVREDDDDGPLGWVVESTATAAVLRVSQRRPRRARRTVGSIRNPQRVSIALVSLR